VNHTLLGVAIGLVAFLVAMLLIYLLVPPAKAPGGW